MDSEAFEHHLTSPQGEGHLPDSAFTVTFGGGACCDEVTFSVQTDGQRVTDAGFTATGCGASHAAASAAVSLIRGRPLLEAARVGQSEIAEELGGLSPGKIHAAAVAVDAMARALGNAVRERGALAPPLRGGGTAVDQTAGESVGVTGDRPVADGDLDGGGRTLVAMSGGVDSSVVALLCARESEAVAVTLELWADPENDSEKSCCSSSAVSQARALAHQLGLPHFTLDLRREFRAGVVEPFITAYGSGDTPNPCIGCNGHVRLDAMLDFAERLGCGTLATGHYARVHHPSQTSTPAAVPGVEKPVHMAADDGPDRTPLLRVAVDPAKDQTYMLSALKPQTLARMRFPLGDYEKPQVRRIAADAGMPVASKNDSQDLCFLAGTDRARFLTRHGGSPPTSGEIVSATGTVLGNHNGHELFTVGQRKGIGVGAMGEPLYVIDKDAVRNRVIVGGRDHLLTDRVRVRGARLHRDGACVDRVKLRYQSKPLAARISGSAEAGRHRELTLDLDEPVAGAAPGQLACLMSGELIVGWATITRPTGA